MHRRLSEARVGRLATVTPEGRPHVVPCCFVLASAGPGSGHGDDLASVYSAIDAKPKTSQALRRLANLRANPAASLLVDHYDDDWTALWWIRVDGHGRVLDCGDEHHRAIERLRMKYWQYRSDPPPGPVIALDVTTHRAWP